MSLGRVSLKAHKTGYALESFEKVQYRMIVIWPCTLDFVISVFTTLPLFTMIRIKLFPRESISKIPAVKFDSTIDWETESCPINEKISLQIKLIS